MRHRRQGIGKLKVASECGGRSLTLSVPHLPPAELNPNNLRRLHWSVRSRESEVARSEVGWLAKVQWHDDKPMEKARISYTFHLRGNRQHDLDNLLGACKAYQDGLIDANVIVFDDSKHLEIGGVRAVQDDHEETILRVEEIV